ncbi:MAG: hypothetical protein JXR87_00095 [Candidatus Marinimicrobia bacterium]|nr:hypothetical protein [Candidatus Neomarinimicrobiota bacterium]
MRRIISTSIILLYLFILGKAGAQEQCLALMPKDIGSVTCESIKLNSLFRQLNKQNVHLLGDTIVEMDGGIVIQRRLEMKIGSQNIPIIIEANQNLMIVHIGVELFNRFEHFPKIVIYRAMERLLLEIILNRNRAGELLKTEGVSVILDGEPFGNLGFNRIEQVLLIMLSARSFPNFWKDYQFLMKCEFNGHRLEWILPAREELITGFDKRELDQRLIRQIVENYTIGFRDVWDDDIEPLENDLWLFSGGEFINGMYNRRYYTLTDTSRDLVFSSKYPRESISNFLQETIKTAAPVNLNLKYKSIPAVTLSISYQQILHALDQKHIVYSGIEEETESGYSVVVVFENRMFNHIHLMSLNLPVSIFDADSITVDARFFPNIRRDNVDNIFSTENVDKKEQLFQIKIQ